MSLSTQCKGMLYNFNVYGKCDFSITKRKVIKKLCEKQVTKVFEYDDNGYGYCPVCKASLEVEDNYCRKCGQRVSLY
ncbi:hypothetical protein DVV91_10295 [Clostridium botulinum]|uniref:hypothetical protein n=1 Tax=Clostridium botulinum TaxID=1491 RepID=UPI0019676B98|nr:hypothetical protein [Clostridium botulinum]MBN1074732.1 hypothetical protein [Clostridium botulinum]